MERKRKVGVRENYLPQPPNEAIDIDSHPLPAGCFSDIYINDIGVYGSISVFLLGKAAIIYP